MLSTLHHNYKFTAQDRFLHQSSICFDLSVVQIFSALTSGGTICVASAAIRKDPTLLAGFMQRSSVSVTYFTPTQFALLLEYANEALQNCARYRIAFFAGERLPIRIAKAFYDLQTPATVYNTWSPSEVVVQTTIHKTAYPNKNSFSIPIGFPLANCRHYIVDSCLNPLPAGLVGEICVGGAQVGAGYLNRPEANAKSFVEDPFCGIEDRKRGWTRLFRTGDKGRFLPDGQLEFHGRIAGDKQIKLRGYRIDLGEVEQRLYLESSTKEGNRLVDISVLARSNKTESSSLTDDRQIIAFIVPQKVSNAREKQSFISSLHERMRSKLNDYMLPNGYQFLEALPVTVGGKVDRQNLLSRDLELIFPSATTLQQGPKERNSQGHTDPKVMRFVIDIFREVLKLPKDRQIAPTDNFFALGGQSILLLRLQAKVKRAFKVVPSLADLFKTPTPAGVQNIISSKNGTKRKSISEAETADNNVNWAEEAALPNERRYMVPYGARRLARADISKILLTGVDSFIGIHMLSTFLSSRGSTTVYVLGTQRAIKHSDLVGYFHKYHLFHGAVTEEALCLRVRYVPGTLIQPHFGLQDNQFKKLGQTIQAIHHFGGQISLLKTYGDLRESNVSPVLDIIELATHGNHLTEINHLSTWSVPHLQSWSTTKRTTTSILTTETNATHFSPPESNDFGYFKSRWAAEVLLTQAAERGFPVSIYRASAVTASTRTKVPEPADDFIRRMVLSMIDSGAAPAIGTSDPQFAVDFIPVDYLVSTLYNLSSSDRVASPDLAIFHVGNEKPLPLAALPSLMCDIRGQGVEGRSVELGEWLDMVAKGQNDEGTLRWAVLRDYLGMGHNMFALDRAKTQKAIQVVGESVQCPPVDGEYLGEMWRREEGIA